MAIQRFRVALNQAHVPFVSSFQGRAALIAQIDPPGRIPKVAIGSEENVDLNLPLVNYLENAVPVRHGYKSVGYKQVIAPTVNTDFDQAFYIREGDENQILFSPAQGQNYRYLAGVWDDDPLAAKWAGEVPALYLADASTNTPQTAEVTRAYVDGRTFLCYSRIALSQNADGSTVDKEGSIYHWNSGTAQFDREQPGDASGLIRNLDVDIGQIDLIASSNGYLIVVSELTVFWAPFNGTAFDFEIYANGAVTGAGNQIPEDVKGPIKAVVPVSGGFIIFTDKNAVGASYNSSNFASPWIFKEIPNAGGVQSYEQISVEGTLGAITAYTSGGLQKISLNNAENIHPDATDFLGGRLIERYNFGNQTLTKATATTEFFTKLTYVNSRFLLISYGTYPGVFSFALLYDAALQRWGKLRIVHRDCFTYQGSIETVPLTYGMLGDVSYEEYPETYANATVTSSGITFPRQAVAFLLKTGEVKLAILDYRYKDETDDSQACIILGRLQLSRAREMTIQTVEVEGLQAGGNCFLAPSINGRTLESAVSLYLRQQVEDFAEFGELVAAKNFNLIIEGDFNLSSVLFEAQPDGIG